MGCDIHVYTERKRSINGEKQWFNCDHWKYNPYWERGNGEREVDIVPIYDDRNYALFSLLADVRNYYENDPISQPKGLPQNCCGRTKEEYNYWDCDGHSHSYFTLEELYSARKRIGDYINYSGYISPEDAEKLEENITPSSWCQGTSDKSWVHRKWREKYNPLDDIIKALEKRACEEFWIWDHIDADERKQMLIENADNLRIVFWFDN